MRKIKLYALCLMATVAIFGCSKYDDTELKNDVNDLKSRVEKLETWCNTTNGQISALQGIVSALEAKDFVTGVTPIMEGTKEVGYTITFTKSSPITIMHGKNGIDGSNGTNGTNGNDGVTPIIGVKQDTDGHYYWTIKLGDAVATWLTDENDNKIRTTGDKGANGNDGTDGSDGTDGHSPVLSVADFEGRLYWKIDGEWLLSGSNKVPATGDKGNTGATGSTGADGTQGDAVFAADGIDYTNDSENVIFTLADGTTKITLPKASMITVGFDSYDTFYCSEIDNQITIVLPTTLKESDYNAIVATVANENGTGMDIQPRSASVNTWSVDVTKPTFIDGVLVAGSAKVKLTLPQDKTNYKALLKVTLIDSKGKEYSVSRVVWFRADNNTNVIDNTIGSLSDKITNAANIKQLSIIGSVSAADFKYIRENLKAMEILDLSRSTITTLPERAMAFYSGMGLTNNTALKTIILPDGLTTIGNSAFAMCENLTAINIPKSVRTLGSWMFEECPSIEEVRIPEGIIQIPASAFYKAGIKRIAIPASVTTIGDWAFCHCNNLVSITISASVTTLGESVLRECANLESAEILAKVDILQKNFFYLSSKLQNVKLSTSITTLSSNAFHNTGLTQYVIPSHIKEIKEGAFSTNAKLHTVTLPAGVKTAWNTFYNCKNLKSVTIPEGVTELGAEMFRGCVALESIVLPSTISTICDRAFQDCSALTSLTCKATTVPTLSGHNDGSGNNNFHFYGINSSCVLKRPTGSDYSGWSSYFSGGIQDL